MFGNRQGNGGIVPKKDPYLNTRVRVMKSKLLSREDYDRILKMEVHEISHFLEEGEYKKHIDELGLRYSGADLIEHALNADAAEKFKKVISLADGDNRKLISRYLTRQDISNIKTIMRGLNSGITEDEISSRLIPCCHLSKKELIKLFRKGSLSKIISDRKVISFIPYMKDYEKRGHDMDIASIENWLDINYYSEMMSVAQGMPSNVSEFRTFIMNEIDLLNLNTLFIMKHYDVPKKDIMPLLMLPGANLTFKILEKAASSKDMSRMISVLENSAYKDQIAKGSEAAKKGNLKILRRELDKSLMRKAFTLLHSHPLSIAPVLGYLLAKEVEIRNLKLISRSKSLGLDEDFIKRNLVVA